MLVVNIVVAHVEVDHLVLLVRPHDGIVPTVPDLALLRAGAKREARRVYGKQNVDVWILPEIFFPSVPLVRRRPKRLGGRWYVAGCVRSSTRRIADVGRQVLLT